MKRNPTVPLAKIGMQFHVDHVAVSVQLDIDRAPDDRDAVGETIDDIAWALRGTADALSFRHRHRAELEGEDKVTSVPGKPSLQ
jgi:hypothetical protein